MFLFTLVCPAPFPAAPALARRLAEAGRSAGRKVALLESEESWSAEALERLKQEGCDVALLLSDPGILAGLLARSDLLAIVLTADRGQVRSAIRTAAASELRQVPFYFLLAEDRTDEEAAARAALALAQEGPVLSIAAHELPHDAWKKLWMRAAQIPRLGPRIRSTPPEQERRRYDRWLFRQSAAIWQGGRSLACEVRDISSAGVSAEIPVDFEPSDEMELLLPSIGRFEVEVAHREGQTVGLRFVLRSAAQNALVSELTRLLEASSDAASTDAPDLLVDQRLRLAAGLRSLLVNANRRTELLQRLTEIHSKGKRQAAAA